jgi:hypothetical protein
MGEIFSLPIPSIEKLVLLALADHARDDGTGAYPSIDLLARKSSLSRRGTQKVMRRLEQDGWIVPSKVSHGRRTTEYRISLTNREPGSLFGKNQPRMPRPPTANLETSTANVSASNREPGSPESSGTVIEPSGNDDHQDDDFFHTLFKSLQADRYPFLNWRTFLWAKDRIAQRAKMPPGSHAFWQKALTNFDFDAEMKTLPFNEMELLIGYPEAS